jgi:hypothetical protein
MSSPKVGWLNVLDMVIVVEALVNVFGAVIVELGYIYLPYVHIQCRSTPDQF